MSAASSLLLRMAVLANMSTCAQERHEREVAAAKIAHAENVERLLNEFKRKKEEVMRGTGV